MIGYFCDEKHLRQGYVKEAVKAVTGTLFQDFNAGRVGIACDDTNIASQHIAEGLGMTQEGHLRADKRNADGTVTGSFFYGLLREDYFSNAEARSAK